MRELHVVALSGGKDSTAMALRLAEVSPREYTYVCTPTGDELPEMFLHWKRLSEMLKAPLQPVVGGTLNQLITKQKALPNWRQRWCTKYLKIQPYAAWLIKQTEKYDKIISYIGLRADEPEREGGDYSNVPGVEMVFPMRSWGWKIADVYNYLEEKQITIPKRTDCARCFYQTLPEWFSLWTLHPDIYAHAEAQELTIGHTFRSPGRDTWPAGLKELRERFEAGNIPKERMKKGDDPLKCRVCRI